MKIILLQTAIADYRDKFIVGCCEHAKLKGYDFTILTGLEYFEESTRTSNTVKSLKNTKIVKNIFLANRKFSFQLINIKQILTADVVVCELNPRILTTWLTVAARRLLNKKTTLWGHAWARNGRSSRTEPIRNILRNISNSLLLYTQTQKKEIIEHTQTNTPIFVAPNSLYNKHEINTVYNPESNSIIYVGRLVSSKKIDFLISSCSKFLNEHPQSNLEVVGTGDQLEELKVLAKNLNIDSQVIFHGHISKREQLEKIYSRSFVSVSPGYVGLSITQSLSFGIPMLVSEKENHSPELEALIPGFNGDFFGTNDSASLNEQLSKYYSERHHIHEQSPNIVSDCQERYSVEKMVEGFYDSLLVKNSR